MLGTTLWAADVITLGLDEGTDLGSSVGSSDGSNELVLGSDEGIISFQIFTCPLLHTQRRRRRRHPTPYIAVVPLVSVLAVM